RRAHRRRAQDPGRNAVPLDPAHARAGPGGRKAHAPADRRRRRAPPLLSHHPVWTGRRAGRSPPPGADGQARPRLRVRARKSVMRLYRALLRLYPAAFRAEYADEMTRVFEQRRRDAHGVIGVLGLWFAVLADTIISAAQTHWDITRQDLGYALRTLRRAP